MSEIDFLPKTMRRAAFFGLALCVRATSGAQSWTDCDGPVQGMHGSNQGDIVVGAYQLEANYEYLDTDEVYTAEPGESITFTLSTLASFEDFVGFQFVASTGSLYPASADGVSVACGVRSAGETALQSAKADWVLPASAGSGTLDIYVLADDTTWYASTFAYTWGASDDEEAACAAGPAAAAVAVAAGASLLWLA